MGCEGDEQPFAVGTRRTRASYDLMRVPFDRDGGRPVRCDRGSGSDRDLLYARPGNKPAAPDQPRRPLPEDTSLCPQQPAGDRTTPLSKSSNHLRPNDLSGNFGHS